MLPTYNSFKQTALPLLCGLLPCLCFAQHRDAADATLLAKRFVHENAMAMTPSCINLKTTSSAIASDGKLQADNEAYYVFTSSLERHGFVIVSGDERMPEVLAYSAWNDFKADSIPSNVRYWLDCYEEAYLSLDNGTELVANHLETVNPNGVSPLLGSTAWGQGSPYNLLCPSVRNDRCVTGCVATAMAQVMKYHQHPECGKGQVDYYTETNRIHLQKDFSSVQFHWDKMLDVYRKNYTEEEADAVAELMYACGTSVKMDYCTGEQGGSGAYQSDLITAFVDNFSYDANAALIDRRYCSINDWHQILVNELNAGRPVNYCGQSVRDGGHSFVLDGYTVSSESNYPYYHVNWGWNGDCDGYYLISDLHPSENGQHATYAGFNSSQQMTIGIKSEDGINEGVFYLCTPNLYASTSAAKAGSSINVFTASCSNFSYMPFNGTLYVALISLEDGTETILGEKRMKALSYLQGQNNLSIDIVLPSNLKEGQYSIQLRSRQSGNSEYQQVFSRQYPLLTISATGSVTPEESSEAMLGCSELEALDGENESMVCLNIYELQNLLDSPFIGDLKMILSDSSGKQLCSFGDSIQPGELITNEVQEEPLKIQGKLVGEWPDGDYKIYIGARQINTSRFVYVSFYDITQPGTAYHDISLNAIIKEGKLIVGGKTYVISPTSIKQIDIGFTTGCDESINYFHLDGRRINYRGVENMPPGVYILRQGNSSRKMVIK